ncbi:MAG TPA: cation:proton antiporter, partial [Alphaproteobacteria bacterium]|nr:cation:proton antiporter [Alphaproteobacteria bacterium]
VVGFVAAMILFGETVLTRIMEYFDDKVAMHNPKLTFVLGLSLVFLFSYLSHLLGLAAITGAFLVGVSLSKTRVINMLLAGSEYFEIIFTSIFFVTIGIVVEAGAFIGLFWFIIALTIIALATKIIGSGVAAYKLGMNKKDSLIVGVGMAPRGEVAFIIALNGFLLGVITKEIYSAIVFVSFLTTIITLIWLKMLYSKDKGRSIDEHVEFIDLKIKR